MKAKAKGKQALLIAGTTIPASGITTIILNAHSDGFSWGMLAETLISDAIAFGLIAAIILLGVWMSKND